MRHPQGMDGVTQMSVSTFDDAVKADLERLESLRAERGHTTRGFVRAAIARETKVAAGTMENIRRGRLKGVRGWVAMAIRAALVREVQRQLGALEHELEILRRSGVDPRNNEFQAVATDAAAIRGLAEQMK
jgi:hypothetical protein